MSTWIRKRYFKLVTLMTVNENEFLILFVLVVFPDRAVEQYALKMQNAS